MKIFKLIAVFAILSLVIVSVTSCKNKDTNVDSNETGNSSIVIQDIEDDENESLTSEEYKELESAWSELVSKGDALEIVPVTSNSSTTTSSENSSTPASSNSDVSSTTSSSEVDGPDEEPDNNNTSTSSSDGWYPGDWEF